MSDTLKDQEANSKSVRRSLYLLSIVSSLVLMVCGITFAYTFIGVLWTTGLDAMLWAVIAFIGMGFVIVYVLVFQPAPLSEIWIGFSTLGKLFGILSKVFFVSALVAIIMVVASHPPGAIPPYDGLPVFAHRSQYTLKREKGSVEVSRLRYLIVAGCFTLAWHAGALSAICWLEGNLCNSVNRRKDYMNKRTAHANQSSEDTKKN